MTAGTARPSGTSSPEWSASGYFFERWNRKLYVNAKAYDGVAASNRPDGGNAWLTLLVRLRPAKK